MQAGPNALHPASVAGESAWWFDGTWVSVVWSRDGYIYCLSGQQLGLAELLRVAESLP